MKFSTIFTAILMPLLAVAQDTTEDSTTTTSTTTMTRTITLQRVVATDYANGAANPTGSSSDAEITGVSEVGSSAASGLAPMALAGVAGMVVVALM